MLNAGFGLACSGIVLLGLSLKRHYLQVWPQSRNFRVWGLLCRVIGYAMVVVSLWPCIEANGIWIGLVLWTSMLAVAAFLQTMLLTYWPKRTLWFLAFNVVLAATSLSDQLNLLI